MKTTTIYLVAIMLLANIQMARSQGLLPPPPGAFQNLNFEQANPGTLIQDPPNPPYGSASVANALPYWSVYYGSVQQSQIYVNSPSLGATAVTLYTAAFYVIDGNYSVLLQGGAFGEGFAAASISQTGAVPGGMQSLLFEAQPGLGTLDILIGSQIVPFSAVGSGANYTLYGANISQWAGDMEQLTFSAQPPVSSDNNWLIDDISFSPDAVPEPNIVVLTAFGGMIFGLRMKFAGTRRLL